MRSLFTRHHPRLRGGMVLMEVLAALTIFTLVAFSLVMALSSALDVARERNEIETATRGLENQLTLLHAGLLAPVDEDLPDDGSGILYHLSIEPEHLRDQKKQPLEGMYRATITATWKSGAGEENRTISELLYQP